MNESAFILNMPMHELYAININMMQKNKKTNIN